MRKLITALIAIMLLSPVANSAVKWNNSSSSGDSAASWAKTKNSKNGFFCNDKPAKTFTSFGKKMKHVMRDNVYFFPREGGETTELPNYLSPCVNDETLSHYYSQWIDELKSFPKLKIKASQSPKELKTVRLKSEFLDEQLKRNQLLSYIFYADGEIKFDELAPQNRFSFPLNNETNFRLNSVGKSLVSYITGHAICEGYIGSVDETLDSWPIIKNTLYSELKLIDLLNMRARDQHVVTEADGFVKTGMWFNPLSIKTAVSLHIDGTKPNKITKYNYNGFVTNLIMNFVQFKVGKDWSSFVEKIFADKVKISNPLYFLQAQGWNYNEGNNLYISYASRYDMLRIAIAMMEDWQQDSCVGQYLKEVNDRKSAVSKSDWFFDLKPKEARTRRHFASQYGGQFLFNYAGMNGRNILGMDGKGGQSILIDMDNSRIVVINSVSDNYDWYELAYQPIKTGELRTK